MSEIEVLKRTIQRERNARRQAEQLLEHKSRELFHVNEDLRRTATALRLEARMTHAVLQTAAEAIITFNADGIIQSANPAAENVFRCTAIQLVGRHVSVLLPDAGEVDQSQDLDEAYWTGPEGDAVVARNAYGKRHDNSCFEMEMSGSRVQLESGWIFTWMLRDVTGRRNLERQLAFSQKMESVGQLAAGVAHEINTPIQYVGDNTAFLRKAFESIEATFSLYDELLELASEAEPYEELCAQIKKLQKRKKLAFLRKEIPNAIQQSADGAQRVSQIVRAMKEFSHPGSKTKTLTDLNQAIRSTATISRNEWKYVAEMVLDLDPKLPKVRCFPGDLNQAIVNLIVNAGHAIGEALKSNQNGSVSDDFSKGQITVSTSVEDNAVLIRVSDTGTGIPQEIRDKIFDPFFTTKPVGKGTGQGLAIVYSIVVEKHGGSITIDSDHGAGTTFNIRLPLGMETSTAPGAGDDVTADSLC